MAPSRKRARSVAADAGPQKKKRSNPTTIRKPSIINTPPSQTLDVYVFGSGECNELGLGPVKRNGLNPKKAQRPRLNDLLDAKTVGVVQIAVGGMHCVALTRDQKILTWGVNDDGALGRDTIWQAPEQDVDAGSDDSSEDDDESLNPKETTPTGIPAESFGKAGLAFSAVAATGSASFALTVDGFVYGWGSFRTGDGSFGFSAEQGFSKDRRVQATPCLIPGLTNIKSLAAGSNHMQALDHTGHVFAWGVDQHDQLGRRFSRRNPPKDSSLSPLQVVLPRKIGLISCGSENSFAVDLKGKVYVRGSNNFGQCGIAEGAGEDKAEIKAPTLVQSLKAFVVKEVKGGTHHSIACSSDGKLLVWGRCDDGQMGIPMKDLEEEDIIFDDRNKPRILSKPTVVPGIDAVSVAAGIDNSLAITKDGKAYSWGFSANYRTGLGQEDDSVPVATLLENSAVKGKELSFAACGGQFSVLAGPAP